MLNFAIKTARDAGRLLAERLGRVRQINHKSEIELITEVDLASERLIIDRIKTYYPRHSILAEESGETKTSEPSDEMFSAERGRGAALNDRRIHVSTIDSLNHAMVCTGFPYDLPGRVEATRLMADFVVHGQAVRRDGSAALDLANVACGRFEGFWEIGLRPWDVAAGVLIVEEAGGRVTNFKSQPVDIYHPPILASNGLVHEQMLRTLGV